MGRFARSYDVLFEFGVDVVSRKIFLIGEISNSTTKHIIEGLYLMSSTNKTIQLYCNSVGGDMYDMFALYDVMKDVTCDIETIAVGCVMSAAPLIIAAGTEGKRCALPNTYWMLHDMAGGCDGDAKVIDQENDLKHSLDMKKQWIKLLARETGTKQIVWRNFTKGIDKYFDNKKAKELGIIDHIL